MIAMAFLAVISPNLIWNAANGFSTLSHTLDNADWVRNPSGETGLHPGRLAEFLLAQFGVVGPVIFFGLLATAARWKRASPILRFLLVFSLPILALVCVQALLSRAYANWAAAAYIAGLIVSIVWILARHRAWLIASFAINGALCVILPLATLMPETLRLGGEQLLARYTGRAEMSRVILDIAKDLQVGSIVASDRDVLADLFYTGRDAGIGLFAVPSPGRAPHHYALKHPYSPDGRDVLLVLPTRRDPPCPEEIVDLAEITPEDGAFRRRPQSLYLIPGSCLVP